MRSVDRYLLNEEKGIILLLAPPFNNSKLEPGYIKGYVPGVKKMVVNIPMQLLGLYLHGHYLAMEIKHGNIII